MLRARASLRVPLLQRQSSCSARGVQCWGFIFPTPAWPLLCLHQFSKAIVEPPESRSLPMARMTSDGHGASLPRGLALPSEWRRRAGQASAAR